MLAAGLGTGVGDVAMNIRGNVVEQRRSKVLMPFWHGLFSVGGVAGAMAGALAASLGLPLSGFTDSIASLAGGDVAGDSLLRAGRKIASGGKRAQQEEPIFDEPQLLACERPRIVETQSSITRVEILLGIIVFGTAVGEERRTIGSLSSWLTTGARRLPRCADLCGLLNYGYRSLCRWNRD